MAAIVGVISAAFILYGIYSVHSVKEGKDDKELTVALKRKYKKSILKCDGYVKFLQLQNTKRKILSFISSVIYILITIVALLVAVLAIYAHTHGGQFFIGDKAYVTIATGSMSQQNPDNPYYSYLSENPQVENDMGKIPVGSFVEIERGKGNYKLYDVVAFEYRGVTYLHRIIAIGEDGTYTTMGDSNPSSLTFEKNMPASMITGVFTGRQSLTIGTALTFLKSYFGIITIVALLTFLFMLSIVNGKIAEATAARTKILAEDLDRKNSILGSEE